jgi:ABC-2 type transport system permease protein
VIDDIRTMMWKELREGLVRRRGGGRYGGAGSLAFTIGLFGVVLPASIGDEWVGIPAIAISGLVAAMMVMTSVPDSFAGERDRQTLETLLATRLPDRAILLGKLLAATLIGTLIAIVVLVVSLIAANAAGDHSGVLLYTPLEIAAAFGAAVLGGTIVANVGVLVSLRAPSAQAAQRIMGLSLFALGFGGAALASALPEDWKNELADIAERLGTDYPVLLVAGAVAALVAINAALLTVSMRLFRRPRLIRV